MQQLETRLDGPVLIAPARFGDDRGFFMETFRENAWAEFGIDEHWIQDNHSRSRQGVVRGMHFQIGPGTAKAVRCARGAILDVVADLRRGSPTYAQWEAFELTDDNAHVLYIPNGFAHGFCVLSEEADVEYKCSALYSPAAERGLAWNDPEIGIVWPIDEPVWSARDARHPRLADLRASYARDGVAG
jgi:dTDP-4-dehydrorhamnose 3,5-epimerase